MQILPIGAIMEKKSQNNKTASSKSQEKKTAGEQLGYMDINEKHIDYWVNQITKTAKEKFTANGRSTSGADIFNTACPYDDFEKTARAALEAIYKTKNEPNPFEVKDHQVAAVANFVSSRAFFIMINVILPRFDIVARSLCDRSESGDLHNFRSSKETEQYFSALTKSQQEFDIDHYGVVYHFKQTAIEDANAHFSRSELASNFSDTKNDNKER
jgi:hypothetical protein